MLHFVQERDQNHIFGLMRDLTCRAYSLSQLFSIFNEIQHWQIIEKPRIGLSHYFITPRMKHSGTKPN